MDPHSDPHKLDPEELARFFHETYERLAPAFNYETRRDTAVPWENVMPSNRRLMIAVATSVLLHYFPDRMAIHIEGEGKEGVTAP